MSNGTIPLRNSRGLDPTLTHVLRAALRDGREVTLVEAEHGFGFAIDGEPLADCLAPETFDYPLHRLGWSADERELLDELLRLRAARRAERSIERVDADAHTTAEGYDG